MNILVSNIGSTSFKYRLYAMPDERMLARGGVERIGSDDARSYVMAGDETIEKVGPVPDHGAAVAACLDQLTDPRTGCLADAGELSAIGFKAVHAKGVSGVQIVDDKVLAAMEAFVQVAPAHNPPYLRAMRQLQQQFPDLPLVAAFETGFHQTIHPVYRHYAVPREWADDFGIMRFGFHGASHRYIAGRIAELLGRDDLRVISCHLGGSSSLAAIDKGVSIGTSMGMSPQSGLPQNNRVGDFDPFAIPVVMESTGMTLEQVLETLANKSGLLGLSGVSNDLRDIQEAADQGNAQAQLAVESYVASVRDYIGSLMLRLRGVDVLVFTGGIGENSERLRMKVCDGLENFGIQMDYEANALVKEKSPPGGEACISASDSKTQIWIVPTNEEIVVARQSYERLKEG